MAKTAIPAAHLHVVGSIARPIGSDRGSLDAEPKRTRRASGEGSVYQAADGRWRGTLQYVGPDGRTYRKYASGRTEHAARTALRRIRAQVDGGRAPVPTDPLAAYLTRWLATARGDIRPATWRQREQMVQRHIIPTLGAIKVDRLLPADVERMTSGMVAAGLSPTTAIAARMILRRALADAQRDGLVPRNVAALARPPRKVRAELVYLPAALLRLLMDQIADDAIGPLVTVAATTGLRQGELLGLRWQDVDPAARTLTVSRSLARSWDGGYALAEPKTSRSRRTLNLPARAVAALDTERARQAERRAIAGDVWQDRDGLVFTSPIGRPLHGPDVTHAFQRVLRTLALPVVPFHALRHSAATALLAAGVPLKVVSDTLGHSSIAVTADTYAHVTPELRREAADAMDRALG